MRKVTDLQIKKQNDFQQAIHLVDSIGIETSENIYQWYRTFYGTYNENKQMQPEMEQTSAVIDTYENKYGENSFAIDCCIALSLKKGKIESIYGSEPEKCKSLLKSKIYNVVRDIRHSLNNNQGVVLPSVPVSLQQEGNQVQQVPAQSTSQIKSRSNKLPSIANTMTQLGIHKQPRVEINSDDDSIYDLIDEGGEIEPHSVMNSFPVERDEANANPYEKDELNEENGKRLNHGLRPMRKQSF